MELPNASDQLPKPSLDFVSNAIDQTVPPARCREPRWRSYSPCRGSRVSHRALCAQAPPASEPRSLIARRGRYRTFASPLRL